jgi:putative glutamine amidotransferase
MKGCRFKAAPFYIFYKMGMTSPIIGLTTCNDENKYGFRIATLAHKYIAALIEAAATPVLIPSGLTAKARLSLLGRLDGLLLTGGGDIAVERFNGRPHPSMEGVDLERDEIEIALVQAAVTSGKPFLGICRGFQLVNIALGGTLYTHLQDQYPGSIKHDYDSGSQRQFLAHEVILEKDSRLAAISYEIRFKVNSLHHQGVNELSPAMHPAAYAPDGLIEAGELRNHPFGVAVQWHPEWLMNMPSSRRLFRAFVDAAGHM